jgi:hypothetical protein
MITLKLCPFRFWNCVPQASSAALQRKFDRLSKIRETPLSRFENSFVA